MNRDSWIVNRCGLEQPLLFEQLSQILKHGVFFVRARAISVHVWVLRYFEINIY